MSHEQPRQEIHKLAAKQKEHRALTDARASSTGMVAVSDLGRRLGGKHLVGKRVRATRSFEII